MVPVFKPLSPFGLAVEAGANILCAMLTKKRSTQTTSITLLLRRYAPRLALILLLELGLMSSPELNLSTAQAQTSSMASGASTTPSAGLANDWLREQSTIFDPFDIGGQFRARAEHKEYYAVANEAHADFQHNGDPNNSLVLFRERFHLGYAPCAWFGVYGEFQDSAALSDDRSPSPENDHGQLRQAWVSLGSPQDFPLTAKVGRQELIYGEQRLIGTADWLNIGRTFDAAKLRYAASNFWVDAFVSRPILTELHEFDESDNYDTFSGVYASTRKLIPFQESQLYFLSRNVDEHPLSEVNDKKGEYPAASPRDIYTVGARVKSLPGKLGGWDYEVEGAGQFGRYKSSNTSPSLDQRAFAVHAAGGYTFTDLFGTPRVSLEYNYASGDSNPNDGTHGTFDNLFPSNHGLYGVMDFFSWQNMQDLHAGASIKPIKNLTVRLDGHAFWLADDHDFFYNANGTPRTTGGYGLKPAAGNYVGAELDLIAAYAITPYAGVQAGFGHFFVGDYIKNSLVATGSTDANFIYAQLTVNF